MRAVLFIVFLLSVAACKPSERSAPPTNVHPDCDRDYVLVEVDTVDFWHVYLDDRLLQELYWGQPDSLSLELLAQGEWMFLLYGTDMGIEHDATIAAYAVSSDSTSRPRRLAEGQNRMRCIGFPTKPLLRALRPDEHLAFSLTPDKRHFASRRKPPEIFFLSIY